MRSWGTRPGMLRQKWQEALSLNITELTGAADVWHVEYKTKRGVEESSKACGLSTKKNEVAVNQEGDDWARSKLWAERGRIYFEYVYFEMLIKYPEGDAT